MYFGVDYYPEHWVYPFGGTEKEPEARWARDIELMVEAGVNVVRMGEFAWGLFEPEDGRFEFSWMKRVMDQMGEADIDVVLGTPTAAPPLWLTQKHPEVLPVDERGTTWKAGTRRAACMNSDVYWDYSRKIVRAMAETLGKHPALIAWQIDNGLGGHNTASSFNEESRRDWHAWLKAKYQTIENLNNKLGLRFWGQVVTDWDQVPMPQIAPADHNPALVVDWKRFCSDTIVAYARMQADLLRALTPDRPVTQNLRALYRDFDHFDMAEVIDFVSVDNNATIKSKAAEMACEVDMLRSLKKTGVRTPDGDSGFWVIEQKAGHVDWQEVNSLVRPGIAKLFTYQQVARGACGILFFLWRQPRFGVEKFYGGVLSHDGRGDNRVYQEIKEIGLELKILAPVLKETTVKAQVCILHSHDNDWSMRCTRQPNRYFNQREHAQLFYNALHDRNLTVDFARPTEDLSKYKIVIAPSLQLLAGGEADLLKLYVQNGGTLVCTCNTGLVDEHHIAPDTGFPHDMTDLFGLEVREFDPLPPKAENHFTLKGQLAAGTQHPARLWCDVIDAKGCQVLGVYTDDFYSGRPAVTVNTFGLGRAIYIGTVSQPAFYNDLVVWLRQLCRIYPELKVPDTVQVSLRQKDGVKVYFLLNHHPAPARISFVKPMHDYLKDTTINGNYDLPAHGVLVLHDEADVGGPVEARTT